MDLKPNGITACLQGHAADVELSLRLSVASLVALVVSPIAGLGLSMVLLVNLSARTPRPTRWILASVAALSLAIIAGSRPLDPNASNDIDGYYDVYLNLASGDLTELSHFGGGFEMALPLLMHLWGLLLPPLSVNGLMFCLALTSALLVLVWVERTFYSDNSPQPPALAGACILMLNLYFATQLSRQFLALVILLYAFTAQGRARKAFFLIIACSFHLTALPFFAIYQLARHGWRGWMAIMVLALLIRMYFSDVLVALDILPETVAEKLLYYVNNDDETSGSDIGSLRMIFLLGLISMLAMVASRFRPSRDSRVWLAIPWITAAVHLILLPVPLASLRTTLMVHSLVPGLIAHKMLSGRARSALLVTLNVLLVYKIVTIATAEQLANLRPTITMASSFFL